MDVTNFLKNFVNKTENIKDLLSLYLNRSNYTFCSLFWKKNNTVYALIDHIDKNSTNTQNDTVTFTPYKHFDNIFISNTPNNNGGYKSNNTTTNVLIIPINICTDVIGVICLGNKQEPIKEEDVDEISDLIALTQIIVNKHKLIEDYKKIYSDSTYFSKDLFLANMSHEIRTPLNGIIGYNQLLMTTELSQTQKGYLASASQCSVQLLQIINDIIDFSKLSSGNMKISTECFAIKEMTNNIYETMKERLHNKKHNFSVHIDPTVPDFIIMDKSKLTQIIINILSNSIKYTPIGGKIEIVIKNTDHILSINVIDNGIGINEQDQCKLFNSFTQIQNSLTKKTGSGLGLAISKRLVELLDGTIDVKSCLGQGSTFSFTCKHQPIKDFEEILKKDLAVIKNRYILLVDDNPESRIIISDMLFEWKTRPIVCASAKEAICLILNDRYKFDMALIDICMPEINGPDLAKQIKHEKPLFPLVALSDDNLFVNMSNFDARLNKPINKLQLFNIIHKIITQSITNSAYIGSEPESDDEKSPQYPTRRLSPSNSPTSQFDKNIRILIAEDVIYSQTLLENMCQCLGYTNISVSSDGQETIELLDCAYESNYPFSILFLDLRMPKIDGYDVINHITNKGYPLPKIITVTASVLQEDRERCKELGVKYFINKPVDLNQLKNVLLKVSQTLI